MRKQVEQFKVFYPYYLQEHSDRRNSMIHFMGANLFFLLTILSFLLFNPFLFPAAVFAGYFLPHIGHVYFQKNKSMRISHPVFCVIGAFVLYIHTWKNILKYKSKTEC